MELWWNFTTGKTILTDLSDPDYEQTLSSVDMYKMKEGETHTVDYIWNAQNYSNAQSLEVYGDMREKDLMQNPYYYDSANTIHFKQAVGEIPLNSKDPFLKTMEFIWKDGNKVKVTLSLYKFNDDQFNTWLGISLDKCDSPIQKSYTTNLESPGFLILNDTDFPLDVSLEQVGPLYYGIVQPGQTWHRNTGAVWFTVATSVNFSGKEKYDDWDCIAPVAQFVIENLEGAFTIAKTVGKGVANQLIKLAAKKAAENATKKSLSAQVRTFVVKGIDDALVKVEQKLNDPKNIIKMAKYMQENYFTTEAIHASRDGVYAGYLWPSEKLQMYRITGGPKKPCINADGEVEFPGTSPLKIEGPITLPKRF